MKMVLSKQKDVCGQKWTLWPTEGAHCRTPWCLLSNHRRAKRRASQNRPRGPQFIGRFRYSIEGPTKRLKAPFDRRKVSLKRQESLWPTEDLLSYDVESMQRIFLLYIRGLLQGTELFRSVKGPQPGPDPQPGSPWARWVYESHGQEPMGPFEDHGPLEATVRIGCTTGGGGTRGTCPPNPEGEGDNPLQYLAIFLVFFSTFLE